MPNTHQGGSKRGVKRKTPKIHAAQTRCRCNKIGPSRGESEGSGVFGGQQDKIWLLQQTLAASPHKGEKSADHTSTSKKLPIADTLNRVIVRMALKSERHDGRRTRKGKSTWRGEPTWQRDQVSPYSPSPYFQTSWPQRTAGIRKDELLELEKDILHGRLWK